ncbi:MAG: phosphate/phosphite/phosphonate ABC transporter substrate-binding protein [Gammaproteobacteria bacterium]|nr:phosphate/phosphite/phosphonate ABC transporter substrate-binding protein [Gammaproteobacteria bacterium]
MSLFRFRKVFGTILSFIIIIGVVGCQENTAPPAPKFSAGSEGEKQVYRFGIHPLHNPARLHEIFSPLMSYLNQNIDDVEFRVEASRNYAAYDKKLFAGEFHFSLPNPYQTVRSLEHGYKVFGKMGDDDNFRGIILVRKDSNIKSISDLKGKPVSYPAPTALAATMMPQYYIHTHGLDVMKDVDNRYVGSQESSIMNVFLGDTVAGATWPPPWRALSKERPELARELEIKWQTKPLPNNGLVVRQDMPGYLVQKVSRLMFELHKHEGGRAILERMELTRFEPATDATYQPVREFLAVFKKAVRDPASEK